MAGSDIDTPVVNVCVNLAYFSVKQNIQIQIIQINLLIFIIIIIIVAVMVKFASLGTFISAHVGSGDSCWC